jgi:transglutaminase-like putative cysteine protease
MEKYLRSTRYLDHDNPVVAARARGFVEKFPDKRERAIALFYHVRDGIRYNPYVNIFDERIYIASNILRLDSCFCVPKAIALASLCRAAGIPARLRFATIRNLRVPESLMAVMKTDIFYGHGFTELFIDKGWIKATPAFDAAMCRESGLRTVEFDGSHDAVLPDTDLAGRPHIEYLEYMEPYDDVPFEWIQDHFNDKYGDIKSLINSGMSAEEIKGRLQARESEKGG